MGEVKENPLGIVPVSKLLLKFAGPAVISMLVASLYNIVDQVFIGWGVGMLGNAATNVMYPIPTISISVGLLAGIGGAANYNICSGEKREEDGLRFTGNSFFLQILMGLMIMAVVLMFLRPLLHLFGATDQVMPYAIDYTRVIAYGIPFFVVGTGGQHLIRADRSPMYSMLCAIAGAAVNVVLDPVFIFALHWGVKGAAWATVIGQLLTAFLIFYYFLRKASMRLEKGHFKPGKNYCKRIFALGAGATVFNLTIALSQIVMNNVIRAVGPASDYGVEIPLACVGIIVKVEQIFHGIFIGIHQGCQPVVGYNYGAKKYDRVRETYLCAARVCIIIGAAFFVIFMLFPREILALFGTEEAMFFEFGIRFFRIYLIFALLNAIPLLTSGFFTAMGKGLQASLIPVVKNLFTFIPLLLLLSAFLGLDGVMYAGAISDAIVIMISFLMARKQLKELRVLS